MLAHQRNLTKSVQCLPPSFLAYPERQFSGFLRIPLPNARLTPPSLPGSSSESRGNHRRVSAGRFRCLAGKVPIIESAALSITSNTLHRFQHRIQAIQPLQNCRLPGLVLADETGDFVNLEGIRIPDRLKLFDVYRAQPHTSLKPFSLKSLRVDRIAFARGNSSRRPAGRQGNEQARPIMFVGTRGSRLGEFLEARVQVGGRSANPRDQESASHMA